MKYILWVCNILPHPPKPALIPLSVGIFMDFNANTKYLTITRTLLNRENANLHEVKK